MVLFFFRNSWLSRKWWVLGTKVNKTNKWGIRKCTYIQDVPFKLTKSCSVQKKWSALYKWKYFTNVWFKQIYRKYKNFILKQVQKGRYLCARFSVLSHISRLWISYLICQTFKHCSLNFRFEARKRNEFR